MLQLLVCTLQQRSSENAETINKPFNSVNDDTSQGYSLAYNLSTGNGHVHRASVNPKDQGIRIPDPTVTGDKGQFAIVRLLTIPDLLKLCGSMPLQASMSWLPPLRVASPNIYKAGSV